jgi:dTDP-4-amino-4,6-dideoxygalactose transaminase
MTPFRAVTIPLAVPDLRGREAEYLARCVADNWVSSAGPFVTKFEQVVAERAGRHFGVATMNGTTALQLALVAAGVRQGTKVVVADWTFAATANAVYHAGATPYFVDVDGATWTLDPSLVAEVVVQKENAISAVIAVHAMGTPADMDPLRTVCAAAGIPLIEDAAGAIGAQYKGRPVGALGDLAMFSFNGNKTVTAGGGGIVVTDDEAAAQRVRWLSTQARAGDDYSYGAIGFNFRMTNLNAAVGLAQMERLDEMLQAKRAIAARYDQALSGRNDLAAMPRPAWADSACWMYCVASRNAADAAHLVQHLNNAGIQARGFWRSLSAQAPYADAPRRLTGVSAQLTGRVVSLPCSSSLEEQDQIRILEVLSTWRGTASA